jgi:hypothetical protein
LQSVIITSEFEAARNNMKAFPHLLITEVAFYHAITICKDMHLDALFCELIVYLKGCIFSRNKAPVTYACILFLVTVIFTEMAMGCDGRVLGRTGHGLNSSWGDPTMGWTCGGRSCPWFGLDMAGAGHGLVWP